MKQDKPDGHFNKKRHLVITNFYLTIIFIVTKIFDDN